MQIIGSPMSTMRHTASCMDRPSILEQAPLKSAGMDILETFSGPPATYGQINVTGMLLIRSLISVNLNRCKVDFGT